MRPSLLVSAAALVASVALPLHAQHATPLARGRTLSGHLEHGDTVRYAVALGARQFVYGEAGQKTVDLVVTIFGPDGRRIGAFDGPARGVEPFQFSSTEAGTYRIEITPFEQETGDYDLVLRQVEPLATQPAARVDQLMSRWSGRDRPGGVVAVTRGGRIVFQKAWGMADLEDGIPNSAATIFHVASLSKQFTAFAIAMLADQGRLTLQDDVRRWLPNVPDFGQPVTLRHLLNHTSGLRDQWELWSMAGGRLDDVIRQEDLLRLVERQRELNFAPGAEYLYCNTGYMLLSEVVGKAGDRAFPAWMQANVFGPLGMRATQVYDDDERLVPGRAYSYQSGADGWRKSPLNYSNMGATSLFTTVGDLALWLRNWHTAEVGGPRVIAMMQQRGVLNRGDTISYALGIGVGTYRGRRLLEHGGADAGYRTSIRYFPEFDGGVVVLGNAASFDAGGISLQVAEAFFEADLGPPPVAAAPAPPPAVAAQGWAPDSAALAAFTGRYLSDELETMYTVTLDSGRLVAHHRRNGDITLRPVARDAFEAGPFYFRRLAFERGADGAVSGFRATGGRVRRLLFRKVG